MAYNFNKNTCDVCGKKKEVVEFDYQRKQASFRLGYNGEVWCGECHQEKELKSLFDMMDKKDKKRLDNTIKFN